MTTTPAQTPLVPISWGELFDKVTILEIKVERLTAQPARENVVRELGQLREVAHAIAHNTDTTALVARLKAVNETLWKVEDDIRDHQRSRKFDSGFVDLARSIYRLNDERAALKRSLNLAFGSKIIEEKSYSPY